MQIVIDISEGAYKRHKNRVNMDMCTELDIAVVKGTPLPQGHGRLIDYSWVVDNVIKKLGIKDKRYLLEAEKALMSIVDIAPTIIEADKAESEG